MRKLTTLVLAGMLGGMMTIGIYKAFDLDQQVVYEAEKAQIELAALKSQTQNAPAINYGSSVAPAGFTLAAKKSMPSVVHIKSSFALNARTQSPQGSWDPFRDFFGDDIFGQRPQPGQQNPQKRFQQSTGSGVILSSDGLIVTNNHVVENADKVEVTTYDARTYTAKVLGTDPTTDIALLQIEESGLPVMPLTNSDNAEVGEWVLAVGNPFNLASTVTAGIISAKGRNLDILKDRTAIESFIQTDAAVNPGNSGGALVNMNGDLLGINTAIATPTGTYAGYSFAVPVNIVKKVTDDLLEHGVVQRGFLGVNIRDLDSQLAGELGLDFVRGVYVDGLLPSGAAAEAGIQEGDVIIGVDGKKVQSSPELQELIGTKRPGDTAVVELMRNGRAKTVTLKLKNRSGNTGAVVKEVIRVNNKLGAELKNVDRSILEDNGLPGGVMVGKIYDGPMKEGTDIQEGFVITKIDEHPISNINELNDVLDSKTGGVLLEGVYPGSNGVYYYGFGIK